MREAVPPAKREQSSYKGTSAATDRRQVPAGLKAAIAWDHIKNSYTVLDWGSGTGVQAAAYLQEKLYNPIYMPYDPYNIKPWVNNASVRHAIAGRLPRGNLLQLPQRTNR